MPPKVFQRQYTRRPSQPQTMCNYTAQDLHNQHLRIEGGLRPPGQLLQQSLRVAKEFLLRLSETLSGKLVAILLMGLDLTAVHLLNQLNWTIAQIQWRLALIYTPVVLRIVLSPRMNPGFHCKGQTVHKVACGREVCRCQICGSSGSWWRCGYGMDKCVPWTTNTGAFYWWHFECR